MNPPLDILIKQKFGSHRGLYSNLSEQNTLPSIKKAIILKPPWVEFDIVLAKDGTPRTSHPPQEPQDRFEDVLALFKEKSTYPKVDIKLPKDKEMSFFIIDRVLKSLDCFSINFALITMGGGKEHIIETENYLFQKIENNSKVKFDTSLVKHRGIKESTKEINRHIEYIKSIIYSLSVEIYEEDWAKSVRFAKRHQIENINFWLRSWPSVIHPRVNRQTIYEALKLEKKYNVKVGFDINPQYIR